MTIQHQLHFLNAIKNVTQTFIVEPVEFGEGMKLNKSFVLKDISAVIGITGDRQGHVYISMDADTGKYIASSMLGGMEVTEVDEMVISAVGELANMIMGQASVAMSTEDVIIDITPPTVVFGEKMHFYNKIETLTYPVQIGSAGTVDVDLAIRS